MTPYERCQKALQEIGGKATEAAEAHSSDNAAAMFTFEWIARAAADALVEAHKLETSVTK